MDRVDGIVQDRNQEESGVTLREKHVLHVAMTIPGFFQAVEAILRSGRIEEGSVSFDLYNSYNVLPTSELSGQPSGGSMANRAGSRGQSKLAEHRSPHNQCG
jgi:hypothetical protein